MVVCQSVTFYSCLSNSTTARYLLWYCYQIVILHTYLILIFTQWTCLSSRYMLFRYVMRWYYSEDLVLIREEIRQVSEQYSVKCLECAELSERLEVQSKAVQDSRRQIHDLLARQVFVLDDDYLRHTIGSGGLYNTLRNNHLYLLHLYLQPLVLVDCRRLCLW